MNKYFIITVDTEGDNLWGVNDICAKISTQNAEYLYRFQELCEKYDFIPVYLTNHEMAINAYMIELGRKGIKEKKLEIGAHEHSWNQPPYHMLIKRPFKRGKPYLKEYPDYVIYSKLEYLTKTLEDIYQCPITSHRGGRWCLDTRIIKHLITLGYSVDCTCTPGISWANNLGWSLGSKGTDWSGFENEVFYFNGSNGKLLEVPVSISKVGNHNNLSWLRPNLGNLQEMFMLVDECTNKNNYLEFMIHSSELMPGGSFLAQKNWEINLLYENIENIFEYIHKLDYEGISLSEFAKLQASMALGEKELRE